MARDKLNERNEGVDLLYILGREIERIGLPMTQLNWKLKLNFNNISIDAREKKNRKRIVSPHAH